MPMPSEPFGEPDPAPVKVSPWGRRIRRQNVDHSDIFRGFLYAAPICIVFWALIFGIVRFW